MRAIIWMHPCRGLSCFSNFSFHQQKLLFLTEFSVKEGRPPRGKPSCSTDVSAFAPSAWTLNFFFFPIVYFSGPLPPSPSLTTLPWCWLSVLVSNLPSQTRSCSFCSHQECLLRGGLLLGLGEGGIKTTRYYFPCWCRERKGKSDHKQKSRGKHQRYLCWASRWEHFPRCVMVTSSNANCSSHPSLDAWLFLLSVSLHT